ncbi:MAG: DUF6702 family protein [Pseudomonadota bacterium]
MMAPTMMAPTTMEPTMTAISERLALVVAILSAQLFALIDASAHQQKTAITTVLFNARTGNLEVAHEISVHDAEHAAKRMWGYADLVSDNERQARFADYVRSRFSIKTETGAPLALTPIGHEIEGPVLWIYHEAPAPEGASELVINDKILQDFWTDQVNLVNVERGEFRGSLIFREESPAQSLPMAPAAPEN